MKTPKLKILTLALLTALSSGQVVADDGGNGDGGPVSKRMSNIQQPTVQDYIDEAEHAYIAQMKFYVTAQKSDGSDATGEYFDADYQLVETRTLAKPLIGVYQYGPFEEVEGVGFIGHGRRDAYASVSLDDGMTWKETNLSESASETSCDNANCNVIRNDIPLFSTLKTPYAYPGDVLNMFHSIAGNKVLVAWPSRFCGEGQPNYSLDNPEASADQIARREGIASHLGINLKSASPDDLYLIDMFGVGGSQGSVNYAEEDDYEPNQAVGAVPYACLWTARGVLNQGDDPRTEGVTESSYMRWFKAERLTSGVRDVNRIETVCVSGAGCAITWQEDPDGLRGGQGEGPGEGWSGAVANSQTDVWYSYIDWEHFDVVQNPANPAGDVPMTLTAFETLAKDTTVTQKPKPFVPFAMPMRLTDNAKCNVTNPKPYCYGSALTSTITDPTKVPVFPDENADSPMDYGLKDLCVAKITVTTSQANPQESEICVAANGMPNVGNTAATRPRLAMYGYDTRSPKKLGDSVIDSAFVAVVLEEDKGLGAFTFDANGQPCEQDGNSDPSCFTFDDGKNIKYFTFSMSIGDTVGGYTQDTLLANLTFPGHQLNQPEVDWTTGNFYPPRSTAEFWDFGTYNFNIYNTEIGRRGSWLGQDIYKVHKDTSKATSGLLAFPAWKQGQMNQGGPADVMARRVLLPKNWKLNDKKAGGNPYAFRNMVCTKRAETTNPYYPGGLCLDSPINLSATIPDTCQDSETGALVPCPQVNLVGGTPFGIGDTNPILQGSNVTPNKTKVLSWHQCPASFTTVRATDGTTAYNCTNDLRTDASTLADQSWYNPLDVAKGHRGFLDGDFVMMLYAWSPNWRLNAKGNDRYELYIRRSFTGGTTWTTLPSNYSYWDPNDKTKYGGDGTVTCETFRSDQTQAAGDLIEPRVCNSYAAGAAEQARNVTQHQAMRITTLDPRFAITGSPQGLPNTLNLFGKGVNPYGEDTRNPSRFFVVYETGDNTTAAEGEPEPLDLFYSRAVNFGDDYQVWAEETDPSVCYPSDPHEDDKVPPELIGSGFCNEFDQMEQGKPGLEASEASLTANPGGQFLYGAWAQLEHDKDTGELLGSDAMARRIWWIDDFIPLNAWIFGQGSGDGTPAN
ncbi:MAG: choice-of-anchor O protein [Methylicorpusculum sp.]|uniref:choice-of-anchor O protein n=1 Tax=Methylicorpusculum sp. TaxID=2713644 RepID=UPI0027269D79|nr:choice-of-anchor O protein [Methylicorpusculum sp.]MDO8941191.1 choice-of-anchor O protein [Methylicorpusculum sp.]MDP2203917.1 choice-of-anchor O protein [Methylicorpusculum sp.]